MKKFYNYIIMVLVFIYSIIDVLTSASAGNSNDNRSNVYVFLFSIMLVQTLSVIQRRKITVENVTSFFILYILYYIVDIFLIKANTSWTSVSNMAVCLVNTILIPNLGAKGAVIGTLVAELATCVWQYVKMSRSINAFYTILKSSIYILFGCAMFISVRIVAKVLASGIFSLIMEVAVGVAVYSILCIVYWKITHSIIIKVLARKQLDK